jgi:hypothetical protein
MAKIIKVRCNGAKPHINEVNLDKALQKDTVLRGETPALPDIPERVVLDCRVCTGKVILTRQMIEEGLKSP